MKKIFLIIFHFSLFVFHFSFAQQYGWTDIFVNMPDTPTDTVYIGGDPYYNSYLDIYFINENEGWVTSLQQDEDQQFIIFHTTDGGQSWEIQKHWNYSQAIWMLDAENGYLGDQSGFIMVTHNGGETWEFHGATGGPVTDISFEPGSDTGYVTIDESYYFWQITPSGVNQFDIGYLNYWSGVSATNKDVWICGGIQVFRWDVDQQQLIPELVNHAGYFSSLFFFDKDHGWIGNYSYIRGFVDYDYFWPEIFNSEEDAVTCLQAIDTNNLWATTFDGRIIHTSNAWDYGYIKETNEYWSNVVWVEQPHPRPGNYLGAIQFTSLHSGYACGENNTILKYTQITGLEEQGDMEAWGDGGVEVWPVPTTGVFYLKSAVGGRRSAVIEILDVNGTSLETWNLESGTWNSGTLELDITHLPAGVYFARINIYNELIVKKIIKK